MPAQTICPHCFKRYNVEARHVGKKVSCKGCGKVFRIEDLSQPERTEGGVPVYRPERKAGAGELVTEATPFLDQITDHIERTIGSAPSVFHEIVSSDVHIDLHIVPAQPKLEASDDRPLGGDYVTVVTSGMSSRPMAVPAKAKENGVSEYAELMLALPKNWPGLLPNGTFDQRQMNDEAKWWPFRWLKQMARLPHEYGTFFSHGVTVPNGEPAEPFVRGSQLCCWMVFKPMLCMSARHLEISREVTIDFYALFPITQREMDLKLKKGLPGLVTALADGEVYTELLDVRRRSVV
jgi:hypothetical protein